MSERDESLVRSPEQNFVSRKCFNKAVESLHQTWIELALDSPEAEWQDVRLLTNLQSEPYLRISRSIATAFTDHTAACHDEAERTIDEEDTEAWIRASPTMRVIRVDYDIVYSPSYQVPVLYLAAKEPGGRGPLSADQLYDLLVPKQSRSQMDSVGVMGALSMTDHPITGLSVYFAHPCRTADAMVNIIWERRDDLSPVEYLLAWLGLIGSGVGLQVPLELARALSEAVTAD